MRIACILVAALACSAHQAAVPVVSSGGDARVLAGEWSGEYNGGGTGRSGSILFSLNAATDSAFGDVVMIPRGSTQALVPAQRAPTAPYDAVTRRPQTLTISFVRVSGSEVSGRLEPYHEPECNCTLTTDFTGTLRGDTIAGTFTTTGARGATKGEWKVVRKR
jgi:hypothetical protein